MKLLAIDTSTDIASVSLFTGSELICQEQSNQKTHARFLLPMIDKVMVHGGLQMNQLDAIVFGRGPGSFTGLRIACSIAKGIAYANDIGLIPVSSLIAIAWRVRQNHQMNNVPVLAVLDARMQEMYWSYFANGEWMTTEQVGPVSSISLPEKNEFILAGVGVDIYTEECSADIKSLISSQTSVHPSAKSMIEFVQFASLKPISVTEAEPIYIRNKVT